MPHSYTFDNLLKTVPEGSRYADQCLAWMAEYGASRPLFGDMLNEMMEAFNSYDKKRSNLDAAYQERPHMSVLRASRAFKQAKDASFEKCDEALFRLLSPPEK